MGDNQLSKELRENFEAYSFDYETELSKECRDYFHLWTDGEYIMIYMLIKYGYLLESDFDSGWEKLKKQIDSVVIDRFKYILSCKEYPDEKEKEKINTRPTDGGLTVWHLVKQEYREHASHDRQHSGPNCELCKKFNWTGDLPVSNLFGVEEF